MRHIDYFLFIVPLYLIIINHIYYPQKILNKVLRYFLILFLVEFIVTIDVLGLMIMGHTEFDRMDITIIQLLYILAFLSLTSLVFIFIHYIFLLLLYYKILSNLKFYFNIVIRLNGK